MNCSVEASAAAPARQAVLVVTDLNFDIALFKDLGKRQWAVEYVTSNDVAFVTVKERSFDLIVTAVATSTKQDLELLRRIRAIRPHVKMIILTSDSTPQDVISALRERAFSLFSKPYTTENLVQMMRIALEGPAWDDGIEVASATQAWIRLLVRCEQGTAERMIQFFSEMIDLPAEEAGRVAYAFREMLINAMRHGARFNPDQYVEISYLRAKHAVACRVKDPGEGFSLKELYHAAVANPIDNPIRHILYREAAGLPPGGYGILLSQHLVDELIYNEQGNEVLLIKYLNDK